MNSDNYWHDAKNHVIEKVILFTRKLKEYMTVDKVILFGSWATGSPDNYSDIDIAVFSSEFGENPLRELQFLSKIAWEVDEAIEAVPFPSHMLETDDPKRFVYEIINNGEVIYEETMTPYH